jgi:two-component system sensor histidine kinase BaeS
VKRGINFRLALTHVGVALLAIAIVALIIQFAGGRRFEIYVSESADSVRERLVTSIEAAYEQDRGWDTATAMTVHELARSADVVVEIYDGSGRRLMTGGRLGRHGMGPGMMDDDGGEGIAFGRSRDLERHEAPLEAGGEAIGTAVIYQASALVQSSSSAFRRDVTFYLIVAALGAGAVALLVSLVVSRRISRPLVQLTGAADEIAKGHRDIAVPTGGDDEVGHLARAFSDMTSALARQEEWRRTTTADLAHELRTPLATIQARVEALEDGVLPATAENLRIIGQEVERLGRLLGTLRAMDELDSEGFSLQRGPVDLEVLVRDVVHMAEPAFEQAGLELEVSTEPCAVDADGDRLTQVLGNLLDNARKFTPSGGRVAVRLQRELSGLSATGTPAALLTVSDSGPGIPESEREYVFERFYRGSDGRGKDGAGIGLAIVRKLVLAHGGAVRAEVSPLGGAQFIVQLPAVSCST